MEKKDQEGQELLYMVSVARVISPPLPDVMLCLDARV